MMSQRSPARGLALVCLIACDAGAPAPPAAPSAPPASTQPPARRPADASTAELTGLWSARRSFGPLGPGTLIVERRGAAFTADLAGRSIPIATDGGSLSFELPGGGGSFRGAIEGGRVRGHWITPRTVSHGARHATPIDLAPDGQDRWRGAIEPFEDVFTFHLRLDQRPDDTMTALLRNHERDVGAQLGVARLVRHGPVVRLLGARAGQPEREVATGTYDPERAVLSLRIPDRGGTYDFQRDGDDSRFYPRGRRPGRYVYRAPPPANDGWTTGTLEEAHIDRPAVERFVQSILDTPIDSIDAPAIHGFLIARRGRLVLEEYFHAAHREELHETRSAAKILTTTVIGAAMQAGLPLSPSMPVYATMLGDAPADLDPRKRAMTLEHLLTMSSGYHCDDQDPAAPGNEDTMLDQRAEPDHYRYTLPVPMAEAPGQRAVYCSIAPNLALGVLGRATGASPLDLFDRLVALPLDIRRYAWPLDDAGNPYGGGGVKLPPRDLAKLGQLMLDGGTWRGRRVLSRELVARASSPIVALRGIHYGYLWWVIDYPYKDRTVRAYFAGGSGGQGVTVVPELDLVITSIAGNYSSKGTVNTQQNLVARYLLPAVRQPGDDPSAPVVPRENYVSPYGRSPSQ
jgi:CubicO group peptidase (beta-lactamase class C family)